MKRLVIVLALLVLLSGCAKQLIVETPPQVVQEEPIVVPEQPIVIPEVPKATTETPVTTPSNSASVSGVYQLKPETPFTFSGKKLLLTDMDASSSQFRVEVEGNEVLFIKTKETEVVNGLEMYVDTFKSYGMTDPRSYLNLSIKNFELGKNEYLVMKGTPVILPNGDEMSVTYTKISDSDVRTASVTIADDSSSDIVQGKSARFANYTVFNVKTFSRFKEYALLRVEPI